VFPETIEAALRVDRLGQSSVRYAIGLFAETKPGPAAEGWFVHVFVDRVSRRPVPIRGAMRAALEALLAPPQKEPSP
jgi:acyl-CoA thioester hydrolase